MTAFSALWLGRWESSSWHRIQAKYRLVILINISLYVWMKICFLLCSLLAAETMISWWVATYTSRKGVESGSYETINWICFAAHRVALSSASFVLLLYCIRFTLVVTHWSDILAYPSFRNVWKWKLNLRTNIRLPVANSAWCLEIKSYVETLYYTNIQETKKGLFTDGVAQSSYRQNRVTWRRMLVDPPIS
jgi:hypothetical protein